MAMDCSSSSSRREVKDNNDDEAITNHEERSRCCFQEWMQIQRQDLSHLLHSLQTFYKTDNDDQIKPLLRDCISHFNDYISTRSRLASVDASPFFAPTWCTSLENSLLWLAGCRPSIFIRLLYAISGSHLEARLHHLLQAQAQRLEDLSPAQMARVNALHLRTIREEEKLSGEMASSQEELADHPIAVIANETEEGEIGEPNGDADKALEDHHRVMHRIMEKADHLRLATLQELLQILKPLQALEFLVAGKKLHLSLHQWGKHRDEKHGSRRNNNI